MSRFLMYCGVSCTLISIWGAIQLAIMGVLYRMESVTLYEDLLINMTGLTDMDAYYDLVVESYASVSMNCFYAALGYIATLFLSLLCLAKAKRSGKKELRRRMNEDKSCPEDPSKTVKNVEEEEPKSAEESESTEETESTKGKRGTKKKKGIKKKKGTKKKKSPKKTKSAEEKEKKPHLSKKSQRHKMKRVIHEH